jgi:AbrB family looped-hinge helix DNA binding protein
MNTRNLTSKGQITIPKVIREQIQLQTGQRIQFDVDSRGRMILTPQVRDVLSLKGIVRTRQRRAVTVREMNEAIAEGFNSPSRNAYWRNAAIRKSRSSFPPL